MLKFVGILVFVSVAYAAVSRYPSETKPSEFADQEGCYLSELTRVLPYDQPYYPGNKCAQYVCQKSTNETLYETCVATKIRDGCLKSAVDLSKNYPDCCGKEVCDGTTTTQAPTTEAPTSQPPSNQGSDACASAMSASSA